MAICDLFMDRYQDRNHSAGSRILSGHDFDRTAADKTSFTKAQSLVIC